MLLGYRNRSHALCETSHSGYWPRVAGNAERFHYALAGG